MAYYIEHDFAHERYDLVNDNRSLGATVFVEDDKLHGFSRLRLGLAYQGAGLLFNPATADFLGAKVRTRLRNLRRTGDPPPFKDPQSTRIAVEIRPPLTDDLSRRNRAVVAFTEYAMGIGLAARTLESLGAYGGVTRPAEELLPLTDSTIEIPRQ